MRSWMRRGAIGAVAAMTVLLAGCTRATPARPADDDGPATVAVSTTRLEAVVRALLGDDAVSIVVISPDTVDARLTVPDRHLMRTLVRAECIVLHGLGYEAWVHAASIPEHVTVRLGDIDGVTAIVERTETHQHGVDGAHTHAITAPGAEVDPVALSAMLDVLAETLRAVRGVDDAALTAAHAALREECAALDATFRARDPETVRVAGAPYLARRYGWATEPTADDAHVVVDARVIGINPADDPLTILRTIAREMASAG